MKNISKLAPFVLFVLPFVLTPFVLTIAIIGSAIADTLREEDFDIDNENYLVKQSGNPNSPITLVPHQEVSGVEADIAGQSNSDMVKKSTDKQNTLAILDWPKNAEGRMMTVIARFENDKYDVPACAQAVNLIKDDRYFYPHWKSMKMKSLANGNYLIGIHAAGSDSDGEGSSGWDMIAFLNLSSSCNLSVLHREATEWASGPENTGCRGYHPDYQFLNEQTAEISMTPHTCGGTASPKVKVTRKKIKLI